MKRAGYRQGHVDLILDNLIAAGKAKPMIIVMDNLNAVKPGESAAIFGARGLVPPLGPAPAPAAAPAAAGPGRGAAPPAGRGGGGLGRPTYSEMMFTDLVPMIERTYRVRSGKKTARWPDSRWAERRHFTTVLGNLDKFAYLGGFSGSCGGFRRGGATFDPKTTCNGAFAESGRPSTARSKVLFLGIGSVEGPGTKTFSDALTTAGIHNV